MRTVLITGGSRGIGAAAVRAFCEAGDRVAFFYRRNTAAAEEVARQTGALPVLCDVSDPAAVRAGVRTVTDALGAPAVLVNNAGLSHIGPSRDVDDATFRALVDTDLSGAFYLCREVQPAMIRAGYGRIVNVGSMWGKTGASCEVVYSAAKAGLRGLTMALSKELGPSGITVNCVEPGVIETEMNAALDGETRKALAGETPLGRFGTPEEVAALIRFLASDAAAFITGQCIGIDGGFAV